VTGVRKKISPEAKFPQPERRIGAKFARLFSRRRRQFHH
jgi:hypothetical protein